VPAGATNPTLRLIDYINRYAPEPVPLSYTLSYIPYDWTVALWRR
jgi:hypothetical protein